MARGRSREADGTDEDVQLSFESRLRAAPPPPAPAPPLERGAVAEPPSDLWDGSDGGAWEPAAPRAAGEPTTLRPAGEPAGEPAPLKREPRVFAVSELVRAARLMLEARFADVRVEGEVSGFKRSGPGHLYFCLKDGEAQVDCVMFSREASRLKLAIADGHLVRCRGRLTIYEARGKFQMSVVAIEPAGAGALALAFEQLKQKLGAEGLFAPERKRPLPFLPRRIGVVTSATGAVIRDIIRVAHRRFPVPILLAPTPVQGDGASASIASALRRVAAVHDVDVVIVARGGGSLEDLWAFNDEPLARAIAACRVPVISAVGHETDFTIADFVADLRAPTPSAAAELAVPVAADLLTELAVLARRLGRGVHAEIRARRLHLERAKGRVGDPRRLLDGQRQALDELGDRAAVAVRAAIQRRRAGLRAAEVRLYRAHPQRRIADQRATLAALERRLGTAMAARLGPRRRALEAMNAKLHGLSPLAVLERGYSLVRRPDGSVVTTAAAVAVGDGLAISFADGEVKARVEDVVREEDK
jgi:exodeoxyribonuclease VII large subunit